MELKLNKKKTGKENTKQMQKSIQNWQIGYPETSACHLKLFGKGTLKLTLVGPWIMIKGILKLQKEFLQMDSKAYLEIGSLG